MKLFSNVTTGKPLPSLASEIAVDADARLQSMVAAIDAGTIAGFAKLTITQINGEAQAGA